jgi:hypothetical protein
LGKEVLARIFQPTGATDLADGKVWLQRRKILPGFERVEVEWVMLDDGRYESVRFTHFVYSAAELSGMLRAAGFSDVQVFGGFDGTPYDPGAKRLVAVATNEEPTLNATAGDSVQGRRGAVMRETSSMGPVWWKAAVLTLLTFACGSPSGTGTASAGGSAGGATSGGGSSSGGTAGRGAGGTSSAGAAGSAPIVHCSPTTPFGPSKPLGQLNDVGSSSGARLTGDELYLVFARDDGLYIAERADRAEPFGPGVQVSGTSSRAPTITDDLRVVFFEVRGQEEINRAQRADTTAQFSDGNQVAIGSDPYLLDRASPRLYANDLSAEVVYRDVVRPAWTLSDPVDVGVAGERPTITPDELTLYVSTGNEIWRTVRSSTADAFPPIERDAVGADVAGGLLYPSWISADGCRLYFDSWNGGTGAIYVAEKAP